MQVHLCGFTVSRTLGVAFTDESQCRTEGFDFRYPYQGLRGSLRSHFGRGTVLGRAPPPACHALILRSRSIAGRWLRRGSDPSFSMSGFLLDSITRMVGANWIQTLLFGYWFQHRMSEPSHQMATE